jgi:hypothetical protein
MGIARRDQSGHLRRSEDLLGDVADAFTATIRLRLTEIDLSTCRVD